MHRKRGMLFPKIGLALVALGLALRLGNGCLGSTLWFAALGPWLIGVGIAFILLKLIAQLLFRYVPRLRKAMKAALMLEVKFDPPRPVPGQVCKVSLRLTPRHEKKLERVTVTLQLEAEGLDSNQQPVAVALASASSSSAQAVTMAAGQATSVECSILVPAARATSAPERCHWRATVEAKTNARTPFTATIPIDVKP
jgi:hypothetical protein